LRERESESEQSSCLASGTCTARDEQGLHQGKRRRRRRDDDDLPAPALPAGRATT
jgi:hypothetical protein